ncbi:hypothetical protein AAU61_07000 [Desulfocarbo indianensis]|nr:hypothetical protein AAU61_07000 [Desulfocarbo indianensis]
MRGPVIAMAVIWLWTGLGAAQAAGVVPPAAQISDEQARRQLARVYTWSGQYERARRLYVSLVAEHRHDAQLLLDLAGLEAVMGHAQASRERFQKAALLAGDKEAASLAEAQAMSLWGDFYRAEAIYRARLAKRPQDGQAALALARVLMSSQRFEEAEAAYLPLLAREAFKIKALEGLTEVQWEAGDLEGALLWAGKLLQEDPDDALALRLRGRALLRLERFQEARDDYLRLSGLRGAESEGLTGLGRVAAAQGQAEAAMAYFRQAQAADPQDVEAAYYAAGEDRAASDDFLHQLIPKESQFPARLTAWARLFSQHGRHAAAIRCLRAALAADSDYFPAQMGLAEALAADRQYQQANEMLGRLAGEYPGAAKILLSRARVLAWSRSYGEAVRVYLAMRELNPADPVPLKEGARAAAWGKDLDLTWDLYQRMNKPTVDKLLAARLGEQKATFSARTRRQLDQAGLFAAGKSGEAEGGFGAYEKLAAAWPQMAKGMPPADQKALGQVIQDLRPAYRVHKAAWLEAGGKRALWERRFASAAAMEQDLVALSPGNQEALFDLAQARCALGLCDEEGRIYKKLLSLDPLHNQARPALERLEIRKRPRAAAGWSSWREDGRGEAARMARQRAEASLTAPVACRFKIKAAGLAWWERPKRWGGEARARGFNLEADGPLNAYLSAAVGWTHKDYESWDYGDRDSGFGEVWLNLWDRARLGLGWQREDVVKNAFSLRQGSQADAWWLEIGSWLSRRWEVSARLRRLEYSDGNRAHWESLTVGYGISDHPRELKLVLEVNYRDTEDATLETYQGDQLVAMRHPYWTPQDWLGGLLSLQWRHDLAKQEFCGAERHYYDLRLNLGAESKGNPGAGLEAAWRWEFARRWDLEARGTVYRSREWDADGLWLSLGYRF